MCRSRSGSLQEVFVARRRGTAESLAQEFVERYRDRFKRAVEVFARGLGEALTYLDFPGVHQRHIKSTNVLERLIREVKRRTRVVGVFPGEGSLVNLATVVMLRATEDWAFRRYGHGPALGRGRETHKNRDLTCGGLLRQPLTRLKGAAIAHYVYGWKPP
jgi:transposase-like protein